MNTFPLKMTAWQQQGLDLEWEMEDGINLKAHVLLNEFGSEG